MGTGFASGGGRCTLSSSRINSIAFGSTRECRSLMRIPRFSSSGKATHGSAVALFVTGNERILIPRSPVREDGGSYSSAKKLRKTGDLPGKGEKRTGAGILLAHGSTSPHPISSSPEVRTYSFRIRFVSRSASPRVLEQNTIPSILPARRSASHFAS